MITIESSSVVINNVLVKILLSNLDEDMDNTVVITFINGYTKATTVIPYNHSCNNFQVDLYLDLTGLKTCEDYNMILTKGLNIIYIEKIKLN